MESHSGSCKGQTRKDPDSSSLLNSEILDSFFSWMDGDLFLWDFFFFLIYFVCQNWVVAFRSFENQFDFLNVF